MTDPYIPVEFQDHDLVKTAKVFWLKDPGSSDGWGWPLPVYYDVTSAVFRVFNCPTYATTYTFSKMLPDGDHEIALEEPWQHARDNNTDVMTVNVR